MAIDHRDLLSKYIARVLESEGIDFIDAAVSPGVEPPTAEEMTELERCAAAARDRMDKGES